MNVKSYLSAVAHIYLVNNSDQNRAISNDHISPTSANADNDDSDEDKDEDGGNIEAGGEIALGS